MSLDDEGSCYATELVMFCCAADVAVERVRIEGAASPPRGSWVSVTGTWVPGPGRASTCPAVLEADLVVPLAEPADPYGLSARRREGPRPV